MITHLAISGGGSSGIKFAGSLKYLEETNQLCNIKSILGTSIGAILAVLLSYSTVDNIINNIKYLQGSFDINDINLNYFISDYGFFSKTKIMNDIKVILEKQFETVPTFSELYNHTKKEVIISSFNLNKEKVVYFNYKTHPNMLVSTALSLSINIPFAFEKEIFENELYIDSGLVNNNISWEYFNNIHSKNKLGIYLYYDYKTFFESTDITLMKYIVLIFKTIYKQSFQLYENSINLNNENILILKEDITSLADKLTVPSDDKIYQMLQHGYNEIQFYLKKKV